MCCVSFTVKYDSEKAISCHARTESRISKMRANLRSSTVHRYSAKTGTSEEQEASCAELVLTYHGVKHHQLSVPRLWKFTVIALCVYRL
jgi:hypothetical protein